LSGRQADKRDVNTLDRISILSGQLTSWLTVIMVIVTVVVVVMRYVFDAGAVWLQESVVWMHAVVFMVGAAYTLQQDEHVRVDIFYRDMSEKRRAWVDMAGTLLFLLPLCAFLGYKAWDFVAVSWQLGESSREPGGMPYPLVPLLKSVLLLMPLLLAVQGVSMLGRMEWAALLLFATVIVVLLAGFPVAFTLGGTALLFAAAGTAAGIFNDALLSSLPNRVFGIMSNETLVAVPLFVFMGVTLERARIAEELLDTLSRLFGALRGGLGISVTLVGMLLAASTGIVGATVVTMGLLSLPTMLRRGYSAEVATGTICASGTLGQIIPPSIILVMLGDVMSSAYQQAQLEMGVFSPKTVSVGDLFAGALIPGLLLVVLYVVYLVVAAFLRPALMPAYERGDEDIVSFLQILRALLPPLLLIFAVLGSILAGVATPTEAAGVGGMGALLLALSRREMNLVRLRDIMQATLKISSMVFLILIGASLFSLVFRGFGGDDGVHAILSSLPGGVAGAVILVMLVMFLLGFVLDFIEITFVVVPIVGPVLLAMGLDPVWLGVMIAINLQTSFLTPPFGFALFYLRGVAPPSVTTQQIYRGVIPFVAIQLGALLLLALFPELVTWLPGKIYGN
jgi:tripartite ATP-independent transporter DctM subunit